MNEITQNQGKEEDRVFGKQHRYTRIILIVSIVLMGVIMWGLFEPSIVTTGESIKPVLSESNEGFLSQTLNGIEITAMNFKRSGDWVKSDICYALPDKKDWLVWKASLSNGLKTVREFGTTLIEEASFPATSTNPGKRCDEIRFLMPIGDTTGQKYHMSIDLLFAQPNESEYCSTFLQEIQQELEKRSTNITIKCSQPPVAGIEIQSAPDGMSLSDAENFIHSDEFLYELRGIRGPWEFDFSLEE